MDIQFEGKTVLVTGSARGIGRGIVEGFAASGAKVIASDVLDDELQAMAKACGPAVEALHLDVTDAGAVQAAVGAIEARGGQIDILVHVAGGVLGQKPQPIEDVAIADWDRIYDVNVRGAVIASQAVIPSMKKRGYGRIVVISSGAGLGVSMTGIQAYASAKAAQLGLVRQLAFELGPSGITVNAVAPGFLRTSPDYERQWQNYGEEKQQAILKQISRRRLGRADDIANAVQFLASDQADWITGQILSVNGGHN
jgi:3-oxoacyl-[acyl-carrier protein] reductase